MTVRSISWSSAVRDLKADRTRRTSIREERLRLCGSPSGPHATSLTAWRGCSGRRYVFGIYCMDDDSILSIERAVLLAVHRDAAGRAELVLPPTMLVADDERTLAKLRRSARSAGATEFHAYRLAASHLECLAVAVDLSALHAVIA